MAHAAMYEIQNTINHLQYLFRKFQFLLRCTFQMNLGNKVHGKNVHGKKVH